jgi:heme-degrading monooxygenase HmoA
MPPRYTDGADDGKSGPVPTAGGSMIARMWSGTVRRADADEYAEYIRVTGFAEYGQTPGNRGAWLLRRDAGERTEFITLSLWESEAAIRAFAGDDIEAAVLYPEDKGYLIGESKVTHYAVVGQVSPRGSV